MQRNLLRAKSRSVLTTKFWRLNHDSTAIIILTKIFTTFQWRGDTCFIVVAFPLRDTIRITYLHWLDFQISLTRPSRSNINTKLENSSIAKKLCLSGSCVKDCLISTVSIDGNNKLLSRDTQRISFWNQDRPRSKVSLSMYQLDNLLIPYNKFHR